MSSLEIDILKSIFYFKYRYYDENKGDTTNIGTCFALEINQKKYLVTANHCVPQIKSGDCISILRKPNHWMLFSIDNVVYRSFLFDDIIVFTLKDERILKHSLLPYRDNLEYAQDLFICGFPALLDDNWFKFIDDYYYMPFAAKGVVSSFIDFNTATNQSIMLNQNIYLDANISSGMSGSPVLFKEKSSGKYKVGAVLSGFVTNTDKPEFNYGLSNAYRLKEVIRFVKTNYE